MRLLLLFLILFSLFGCNSNQPQVEKELITKSVQPATETQTSQLDNPEQVIPGSQAKENDVVIIPPPPPVYEEEIIEEEEPEEEEPEVIILPPDLDATFPGGEQELQNFLLKNLEYPLIVKQMEVQGIVFIEFSVQSNGEIDMIKIIKGVHSDLDKAAIKVIKAMPNWIPATHNMKQVESKVILPIKFLVR